MEGVNLLVSSGTASAIAADRLCMVKRKTARKDDTKVQLHTFLLNGGTYLLDVKTFFLSVLFCRKSTWQRSSC